MRHMKHKYLIGFLIILMFFGIIKTQIQAPAPVENSSFKVYYLDVGEADAALIQCDGKNMLIDGGNVSDSSFIYSFLKNHNVSHIDVMVASHAHEDHAGGLAGALNYATVGKVYCPTTSYDTDAFTNFKKYVEKQNVQITVPKAGDTFTLGSAKATILGPVKSAENENNNSLIIRVEYGSTSFLFTGDAETAEEQDVLDSGRKLESTVLKVAHHGSESSTGYLWLRTVSPKYAVISVGENDYGHPTESVLSRLRDAGVEIYRTDMQGTITCESDGKTVKFTVERNDNAVSSTTADEADYVLNTNSHKFHYKTCSSVGQMSDKNKAFYTGTRDEVLAMGYEPCGSCNP